ncbi:MAG: hypothetical protein V4492_01000, partial [Chlamydiota bacterium]
LKPLLPPSSAASSNQKADSPSLLKTHSNATASCKAGSPIAHVWVIFYVTQESVYKNAGGESS